MGGCLKQACGSKNRRQLLILCKDCLMHCALNRPFMWKCGGLVSCKNTWLSSPPAPWPCHQMPASHLIDMESAHAELPGLLQWGHLPAKCWGPIVLNVISSNVLLPQHWSMLSQHNLQVDLLHRPDLITATGQQAAQCSTQMVETADLLIRLGKHSSLRGHLILDKETKTYSSFHFNRNEKSRLYVKAGTLAYCRRFSFNISLCIFNIK